MLLNLIVFFFSLEVPPHWNFKKKGPICTLRAQKKNKKTGGGNNFLCQGVIFGISPPKFFWLPTNPQISPREKNYKFSPNRNFKGGWRSGECEWAILIQKGEFLFLTLDFFFGYWALNRKIFLSMGLEKKFFFLAQIALIKTLKLKNIFPGANVFL